MLNKKVLHTLIDHHGDQKGASIAVETGQGKLSYGELKTFSDEIRDQLLGLGLEKDAVVGLYLPSSREYIASLLGVFKSGGVAMPLERTHPETRLRYQLEQSRPQVLVGVSGDFHVLEALVARIDAVEGMVLIGETLENIRVLKRHQGTWQTVDLAATFTPPQVELDGQDSAYLLYTSGSTGHPKAIEGVHKSLSHFVHWQQKEFGFDDTVRVSQLSPLSFDVSLRDIFLPLLCGGTVCIPDEAIKSSASTLLSWLREQRVNVVHTVPSVFRLLTEEVVLQGKASVERIDHIFLAGEPLYGADVVAWRAAAGDRVALTNLYGPSETTLAKLYYPIGDAPLHPASVVPLGKPIANTAVLILHRDKLCHVGKIGEICLKTPFRSKGYYQDAVLTASKFVQNPLHNDFEDIIYRTGDLGKYNQDREVLFVGRQDSQVKVRGNRVELLEVEQVLGRYAGVGTLVVQALSRTQGELVLVCYYEKEGKDESALRAHGASHLPSYMQPSYYVGLEKLPLNLRGKVDRKALPSPEELLYDQQDYEAPKGDLEHQLSEIWSEALALKRVGRQNNFFQLGGHSLTATRVVSLLYQRLGFQISLKDFFEHDTIASLADYLNGQRATAYQEIPLVGDRSDYALSYSQQQIWTVCQAESQSVAYHMGGAVKLEGALRSRALERSLQLLIEHHESLRTRFIVVGGEPRQEIIPIEALVFPLELEDLQGELDPEQVLNDHIRIASSQSFDLSSGPLLRVKLYQLGPEEHVLFFVMHHIITDGWSLRLMVEQLMGAYAAAVTDSPISFPKLRVQYKDYAHWQRDEVESGRIADQRSYWHEQLRVDQPLLTLPFDHQQGDQAVSGDLYSFVWPPDLCKKIKLLSQSEGVTLFTSLVALVKVLLYKYSGLEDISVGTPVLGRDHPDLEHQLGMFLNVLVVRDRFDRSLSFVDFLHQVKETLNNAYAHQQYPYSQLVTELPRSRQEGQNAFYDVLVVLNTAETEASIALFEDEAASELQSGLKISPHNIPHSTSKLPLSFFFVDEGDRLKVSMEYRTDLFKKETIERIKKDFMILAAAIATNKDSDLRNIVKSSNSEQQTNKVESLKKAFTDTVGKDF